jgi:hypothetical protein
MPSPGYWPGQDLARGVALTSRGGWQLDAWGALHAFGGAPVVIGPYWPGLDLARAVTAAPGGGGWVLDAWGGIHAFGGAPAVRSPAYWPGRDLARALVARADGGGWLVDAFGGVHAFGGAPVATSTAYWGGFDLVRGAIADRGARGGWVVDLIGGVHPFGGARTVASSLVPGADFVRGAVPDPASDGGWVLDAWGGLHEFGGAAPAASSGFWPGRDLVRGGSSGAGGGSGRASTPPPRPRPPVLRTVTYTIAVRGAVRSNVEEFAAAVADTLEDERGWAAAGFGFVRVPANGEMTVWLSQAGLVPSFGAPCDAFYSCRQGLNVIINDDRFAFGSPYWPGPLAEYRRMVIDHETGHWIGFGHAYCGGAGQLAPVMQQQSKGMQGCAINPWPLGWEIDAARGRIGGHSLGGATIGAGGPSDAVAE